MWPKAFAQFVELAPHVARLLPMADRFFQSKNAADDTMRRSMEAMAEGLRSDLGQLNAAQAGLAKQLGTLSTHVATLGGDMQTTRTASAAVQAGVTALDTRFTGMDKQLAGLDTRLAGMETRLERVSDRGGVGPIVLLLVLTNLILLASVIVLLVHRH